MKDKIKSAISIISFTMNEDYDLYLSCLSPDEEVEEKETIKMASETLKKYGISENAILKHRKRKANKPVEPVRFIDRSFKRIETNELPF